jgi:hypothetical protein
MDSRQLMRCAHSWISILPKMNGAEVTSRIKEKYPDTSVIGTICAKRDGHGSNDASRWDLLISDVGVSR